MDAPSSDTKAYLPLTPAAFHVLLALASGRAHGYVISKEIAERTGGLIMLGPATLYRTLTQLAASGLVREPARRGKEDERRRLYELTALGRRVAEAEARRLEELVGFAREKALLKGRA